MLLPDPSKPSVTPESTDPISAPAGDTTRRLADGDLEFGVTRLTTSKTGSVQVPAKDSPHPRAGQSEQLARADLEVMVASRAARPTLCALPRRGAPPRIAGAILVDTSGTKYPLRQDSEEVSLSAPCQSQPPLRVASVSLVFTIPHAAIPDMLLLFDPREPGDTKGVTRLRFPVSAENA
jgi:hypothetical protein